MMHSLKLLDNVFHLMFEIRIIGFIIYFIWIVVLVGRWRQFVRLLKMLDLKHH